MRVVICGAGQVGYNIAAYLSREENDVTVIDTDPHLVADINEELDVKGIVGHASNPEILSQAGANDADLLIAVTYSDEVNMVACQVGHSLFNIPKKIARVREQSYLDPAWSNLFGRAHMPIDVIISPEIEVARAIGQRLHIPGTTNVVSLAGGNVHLAGVVCKENCPLVNTALRRIGGLFPNLSMTVAAILRGSQTIIPGADGSEKIRTGDEVYFFADTKHLRRAMAAFGHEETEARRIVVMGGGNIGLYLVNMLQQEHFQASIKIIERNEDRARFLSERLGKDVVVINGDALHAEILQEANIRETDTLVAVMDSDEANILGSLLAKQNGCSRLITLVNNATYMPLIASLGIDATVSPRTSTVSTIMQHVRRGRIKALHTLRDGFAEVIEAEISETSGMVNMAVSDIDLPSGVILGAIVRQGQVLMPDPGHVIRPEDHVITLAAAGQGRKVEQMFVAHVDLF